MLPLVWVLRLNQLHLTGFCKGIWEINKGKITDRIHSSLIFSVYYQELQMIFFNISLVFLEKTERMVFYQLTFTCSKSTIEALEKGVKYVQS